MNIRSIANAFLPSLNRTERKTNSQQASSDRDAQRDSGPGDHSRRNLKNEEIQEAIEILSGLPGFKENSLSIRVETTNKVPVVFIVDPTGKVIRRIPETELSLILRDKTSQGKESRGRLLNKAL